MVQDDECRRADDAALSGLQLRRRERAADHVKTLRLVNGARMALGVGLASKIR